MISELPIRERSLTLQGYYTSKYSLGQVGVFLEDALKDIPMRRVPRQTRSQERVDLILDTAAELFVEVGYESVTTNGIAARAGISIGSLYQYFPDKDAILHALADRYLEQLRATYKELFTADVVYLPLAVLLDRLIDDQFIAFHDACPAFTHIFLGADVSADMAAASAEIEQETIERVKDLFQLRAPDLAEDQARLLALVTKAVLKALLSLLESSADGDFRVQVISEVKRLLFAYLEPVID